MEARVRLPSTPFGDGAPIKTWNLFLEARPLKLIEDAQAAFGETDYLNLPSKQCAVLFTTLLALVPDSTEGKAAIGDLFSRYLTSAEKAISAGNLGTGNRLS